MIEIRLFNFNETLDSTQIFQIVMPTLAVISIIISLFSIYLNHRKKATPTYIENEEDLYLNFLFSWDEIPGKDSKRLIKFLKNEFKIEWAKIETINKIDEGKTIIVSNKEKSLSLKLNDKKTKIYLKIDDSRIYEFIVKRENGKLNIYEDPNYRAWVRWAKRHPEAALAILAAMVIAGVIVAGILLSTFIELINNWL